MLPAGLAYAQDPGSNVYEVEVTRSDDVVFTDCFRFGNNPINPPDNPVRDFTVDGLGDGFWGFPGITVQNKSKAWQAAVNSDPAVGYSGKVSNDDQTIRGDAINNDIPHLTFVFEGVRNNKCAVARETTVFWTQ